MFGRQMTEELRQIRMELAALRQDVDTALRLGRDLRDQLPALAARTAEAMAQRQAEGEARLLASLDLVAPRIAAAIEAPLEALAHAAAAAKAAEAAMSGRIDTLAEATLRSEAADQAMATRLDALSADLAMLAPIAEAAAREAADANHHGIAIRARLAEAPAAAGLPDTGWQDATSATLRELARVQMATYSECLFWLRQIHFNGAIYLGDHTALTYLSNGQRAFVDTRSRDVGVYLLHGGEWEANYTAAFRRMLRPGARVVDVGANLGWYTLIAAPIVGATGRVYAIEPNPVLAQLVHASVRTNGFGDWAQVLQVAVGDVPGVVDLIAEPAMPGGGFIRPFHPETQDTPSQATRVAALPLDSLLAREAAPIDVVKMDIEGWEGMALRGMAATFDRSPGMRLLVEWGPAQDDTPAPRAETAAWLAARGYRCFRVADDGGLLADSWDAAVAERHLINLVLLPAGDPLAD